MFSMRTVKFGMVTLDFKSWNKSNSMKDQCFLDNSYNFLFLDQIIYNYSMSTYFSDIYKHIHYTFYRGFSNFSYRINHYIYINILLDIIHDILSTFTA